MRERKKVANNINEVKEAMDKTESKKEFQKLQSIYLADTQPSLTAGRIGNIVRLSAYRVKMTHSNFRKYGMKSITDKRGGRHSENMTRDEGIEFLKPFEEKSKSGTLIVASEIKTAYEAKIGREAAGPTICRLSDKHGFRKIVPYKRHKKADMEGQKTFKKTSSA